MTSARILYPDFRDEQSASRYPFSDTATLIDTSGVLDVGADTFTDAVFFGIGLGAGLHLESVVVTTQAVTLNVTDEDADIQLSATYDPLQPPAELLNFYDTYGRPAGYMLTDDTRLARIGALKIGTYSFDRAATEFVASVVIPSNEPGVRGLKADNGPLLAGDVWLIGDQGIQLRLDGANTIRVDVIGEPLFKRFLCDEQSGFQTKKYLRTINDCPPDEFGNFIITATGVLNENDDTVLRIYPENNGIVIDTVGRSLS
jgi:hypothetical protein